MRTNIVIDDELLATAMRASGQKTKRATVEEGLRLLLKAARQRAAFDSMAGVGWDGDLASMRDDRQF